MNKTLTLFIVILVLAMGCTKQPAQTTEGVNTPLDESLENSDQLQDEFNTQEIEDLDQNLEGLDEDLSNL